MKHSKNTTIVITAPTKMVVTDEVRQQVIAALAFIPESSEVRIRANTKGKITSYLEEWVYDLCALTGTAWYVRIVNSTGAGGASYKRDRELVRGADRVIAFFDEEHFMEGGTGHVVQCALEADVPVETWAQTDDGLELVAEDDHGVDHTATWMKSRMVVAMVLKFKKDAESVKRFGPSSLPYRQPKSSSTSTGSTSTVLTGGVKFLHGSTSTPQQAD